MWFIFEKIKSLGNPSWLVQSLFTIPAHYEKDRKVQSQRERQFSASDWNLMSVLVGRIMTFIKWAPNLQKLKWHFFLSRHRWCILNSFPAFTFPESILNLVSLTNLRRLWFSSWGLGKWWNTSIVSHFCFPGNGLKSQNKKAKLFNLA